MKIGVEQNSGKAISMQKISKPAIITIILLVSFLLLLLSSHFLHEHYGGITVDERAEWYNVKYHLARGIGFFKGADTSEVPISYYGIVNTFAPYLITFKLGLPLRDYYRLTHILSVASAVGTVYLLWWTSRICQLRNRWLASVMLLGSPAFFGYSLMNIKDIPIAFTYTCYTCTLLWCHRYMRSFSVRRLTHGTIITAVVAGIFTSLRLTLLPVAFATFAFTIYFSIPTNTTSALPAPGHGNRRRLLRLAYSGALYAVFTFLVATLLLPAAWQNPISFFTNAFHTFRDYTIWNGCTLYEGECTSKLLTKGWTTANYLLQWGFSQPTLLNIFNYLAGIPVALIALFMLPRMAGPERSKTMAAILFSAQAYVVVALAVLTNATLYNGIRHLLFALPATAFLGSAIADTLSASRIRIPFPFGGVSAAKAYLTAAFISLAIVFFDMAALAPYQYSYINELKRDALTAGTTEIEVWDMSLGELYSKTAKVSPLFPEDINKSLILTRESIGITTPASDATKIQRTIPSPIRSPITDLPEGCRVVSEVSRNYALSRQRMIFSAVTECPKGSAKGSATVLSTPKDSG